MVSHWTRLYIPLARYALQSLNLPPFPNMFMSIGKALGAWLRITHSALWFPSPELPPGPYPVIQADH